MVDIKETLELLKWSFGRSGAYVFFNTSWNDDYMGRVISREIIPRFDYTKRFHSFNLMENILESERGDEFVNAISELTEIDLEMMKEDFKPRGYSAFPLYASCSLSLNRKFRRLHDEISSFVYSS